MKVTEKVSKLREVMGNHGISAYVILTSDYHDSEYVGDHFKAREYISGFTGSAGTVVVTMEEAGLWTDGRYFIQAENQLKDTGIKLFKAGEEGVPTIKEYLEQTLQTGDVLGFDGRTMGAKQGQEIEEALTAKEVKIIYDIDLVDEVWEERPSLSDSQAFLLDVKYAGVSFEDKLLELRKKMKEEKANVHIITKLDDIAWLFNIRGRDVKYNPVVLSYTMITEEEVFLYVDESKLSDAIKQTLTSSGVTLKPYNAIYECVKELGAESAVLLDPAKVNYAISCTLPKEVTKIEVVNPTTLMKAVKNDVELENIRNSHLKDGIAFTKLMYWIKNNYKNQAITEIDASDKIEAFRSEQEGFIESSFAPISAFKEHAAMMHYSATPESNATLEEGGLYLLDSGGQYYDGTTDITRTLVLGEVDEILKQHFTAVARGMIGILKAKFLKGCRGFNFDILARGPIWDLGIDYKCGTGHGIGFLLNVHEAPNGFRWKIVPERDDSCEFEAGMVTTNEPGIYIEGSHGIRLENEMITCLGEKNEYGQFMHFEAVTYAPIDLDGINPEDMTRPEREYLNAYHEMVYNKVSPYLTEEEKVWLKEYTRAI